MHKGIKWGTTKLLTFNLFQMQFYGHFGFMLITSKTLGSNLCLNEHNFFCNMFGVKSYSCSPKTLVLQLNIWNTWSTTLQGIFLTQSYSRATIWYVVYLYSYVYINETRAFNLHQLCTKHTITPLNELMKCNWIKRI